MRDIQVKFYLRLPWKKHIQKQEDSLHQKIVLTFREEIKFGVKLCMVVKIGHLKNRWEMNGKFKNMVVEKGGEEQLYRFFEKWRSFTKGVDEEENILQTINKKG